MFNGQKIDYDTLELSHGQWSKLANFDHLATVLLEIWPWSRSKIFDHLIMTPGRELNGQKIMIINVKCSLVRDYR